MNLLYLSVGSKVLACVFYFFAWRAFKLVGDAAAYDSSAPREAEVQVSDSNNNSPRFRATFQNAVGDASDMDDSHER